MAIKIQGDTVIFDDKVFRPAQLTQIQRDAITSPLAGMFVYNTDINSIEVYNGTAWGPVAEASDNFARTVAFLAL